MPYYLFDKAYRVAAPSGVPAHRVVVQAPVEGDCTLPTGVNSDRILGITVHSQPETGRRVTVRKAGTAEVVASTAITPGTPVMVADGDGRVRPVTGSEVWPVNCLGFAETGSASNGDMLEVFICIHQRNA